MNELINVLYLILIISILLFILNYFRREREFFVENMIVPIMLGGLGNQLFALGAAFGVANILHKEFKINPEYVNQSKHSSHNYASTIFKRFIEKYGTNDKAYKEIIFNLSNADALINQYKNDPTPLYHTQLHNYKLFDHVREELISLLHFNTSIAYKYPLLNESAFIHVRGGDFKSTGWAFLDLEKYYQRAIKHCQDAGVKHFYIFTNDKEYINQKFPFINQTNHTYIDEDEIDSLYLMSRCTQGGISSNGTFGWWALYLNINRPNLIIPNRWMADSKINGQHLLYPGFIFMETA